jgi:hypothetical protein
MFAAILSTQIVFRSRMLMTERQNVRINRQLSFGCSTLSYSQQVLIFTI